MTAQHQAVTEAEHQRPVASASPFLNVGFCCRVLAGAIGVLLAAAGGLYWMLKSERAEVRRLMESSRWPQARAKLSRLLWWSPNDPHLRLTMAEAFARDDSQSAVKNASAAVEFLSGIPDRATEGPEARIREARLRFLFLRQPIQAERLVRRVLVLNQDSVDAYALLWRIFDMTGRADDAEPLFRKVYEVGPVNARVNALGDWFFSQNSPDRITAGLDDRMGFRSSPQEPARKVELNRLVAFRTEESDQPVVHAAVARWFQREGDPEQALRVLDEGLSAQSALENAFYVATRVFVLLELGQLDQAAESFSRWPEPHDGYQYRKAEGLLQEELYRNYGAAAEAYAKAIAIWPGPADWKLQFRRAGCLGLTGDKPGADALRQRALSVQELFKPQAQRRLSEALLNPHLTSNIDTIVEFYQTLQREEEAQFWRTLRR